MIGFNVSEAGHIVQVLAPINISGGKTGQAFSMKSFDHASIIIAIGVSAAAPTAILISQCTNASGAGATAIGFNYYACATAGGDVLGSVNVATAAGITSISANDGIFYTIELDSTVLADGFPYVQVSITDSGNTTIAAIIAILSAGRNQYGGSPTQIT